MPSQQQASEPLYSMRPIDVAHAALLEAGRPDLAEWIIGGEDDYGFYLEYDDEILSEDDWKVLDRAEDLARLSIGEPPRPREAGWVDITEYVTSVVVR